jgi:hypothetical protein
VFLYFFLAAVSDKDGLSFYADSTIAGRVRMREPVVAAAREELITHDLIVYQPPLTQVLSLPLARAARCAESIPGRWTRPLIPGVSTP